jgi:dTDP-4-amino-4,6-dideoxygalactose transaminase
MKRKKYLKFSEPSISRKEIREVVKTLKSGWLTTGKRSKLFEEQFAHQTDAEYAVALSSGTAALFLSLLINGVGPGDEVITTPLTFISTANVIHHLGAVPVFTDIKEDTFNIDPEKINQALTKKTKSLLPVHYSGQPCDMKNIMAISEKHNIQVVEDAAHALGAEYDGKRIGGLGNLTCFSLFPTKNITTGEGGVITLKDEDSAKRLQRLRLHGMSKDGWKRYAKEGSWYYEVHEAGYKFNMADLNAALGLVQLQKLDQLNKKRTQLAEYYLKRLSEIQGIKTLKIGSNKKSSWHIFPIWVDKKILGIDRNQLIKELYKRNIGTSVHFIPLHLQPFYQETFRYKKGDFPITEKVYEGIVSLPLFPQMKTKDVDYVVEAIKDSIP